MNYGVLGQDIGLWCVPKRFDFGYTSVSGTTTSVPLNRSKYQAYTQNNEFYTRVYDNRTSTAASQWDLTVVLSPLVNELNSSEILSSAAITMTTSLEEVQTPNQASENIIPLSGTSIPTGVSGTLTLPARKRY